MVPTNAITSPSLDRATTITVDYSTSVSSATSSFRPATINSGAIAGGVGGILGLGLVSGLFLYLTRRKQNPALQPPADGEKRCIVLITMKPPSERLKKGDFYL